MQENTSLRPLVAVIASGLMLALTAPVVAQLPDLGQPPEAEEVTDEELNRFVTALQTVQEIQIETQATMSEAIEAQGMTEQRFSEIHNAQRNPEIDLTAEITEAEEETYEAVLAQLISLQRGAQEEMQDAVASEGFNVQRFNEIIMAIQQDQELAQRVQEMLQ